VWHDEALTSVDWPYYSVSRTSFQNALALIGVLLDFYQVGVVSGLGLCLASWDLAP
jgi:hypothetical protein